MSIYDQFIGTVSQGISNPYGLAAVAATGKHESGYAPSTAYGQWADPSERGVQGTSGGILSWRNERLDRMRQFAEARGDNPERPTPQTQALYFLQEDPALVQRLNNASSVEEAQNLMNAAWRFAGYNRAGGEAEARRRTARQFLGNMDGEGMGLGQSQTYTKPLQGGEYMAGYPSTTGGLGGLGGIPMPQQEDPGFFRSEGFGDVLQSIGMSLMSSPRNAPLQNMPQNLTALSDRRERREESQADRQAIAGALGMMGMSPEQAQMLSRSPQAAQMVLGEQRRQREEAQQLSQANQSIRWLETTDPEMAEFAKANPSMVGEAVKEAIRRQRGEGGSPELGLNPQYGVDENGNPVLLQMGKDGNVVQSQLPPGVSLAKEPIRMDAGTEWILIDPITRQPIGRVSKNIEETEAAKVRGTTQGEREVSAAGDLQAADNALYFIDSLRNDPNRERGTGLSSIFNAVPGTAGYDYQNKVKQVTSGAFLTAIENLRGLGALSNAEGQTATSAVNRMDTATSEEAFLAALDDYERIVRQGRDRALRRLGGNASSGSSNPGSSGASSGSSSPSSGGNPATSGGYRIIGVE